MSGITGVGDWLLKYILPVVLVPLLISGSFGYAALQVVNNQQENDAKRIEQLQKSTNINRVELSNHNERLSKIEILIESVNDYLSDTKKELRLLRSDVGKIEKIVVVLKDREEREHGGK